MDLGVLSNTGFFPKSVEEPIFSARLDLVRCECCDLVQLGEDIDTAKLFSPEDYGYSSSLNDSMVSHLERMAKEVKDSIKGVIEPKILDIGANDGTLLNHCLKIISNLEAVAVDPTLPIWQENYDPKIKKVADFFSSKLLKNLGFHSFDVVTSIAMFYDLKDPLTFAKGVSDVLQKNGIWILEQSYLPIMIKQNSFDTICHEHLEYYNLTALTFILREAGFQIRALSFNESNGGSIRIVAQKSGQSSVVTQSQIEEIIKAEQDSKLNDFKLLDFMRRVRLVREEIREKVDELNGSGKLLVGLGASTKGNTLLQYFNLTSSDVSYVEEINPRKHGRFTPGSHIPIVLENSMLVQKVPDAKLVLPWHFRDNILKKQKEFIANGGVLIFPLPTVQEFC